MKQDMTKYEAEQVLGLKGAYSYKDTVKAYREKVKVCHPDVGGSAEDMVKVNKAKDYMDKLFAGNKNAVMNCDSTPKASTSSTYTYTSTAQSTSSQSTAGSAATSNAQSAANAGTRTAHANSDTFNTWWDVVNAAREAGGAYSNNMTASAATAASAASSASATASRAAGATSYANASYENAYPPPTGTPIDVDFQQVVYDQVVDVASDFIASAVTSMGAKQTQKAAAKAARKQKYATPSYAENVARPAWYNRIDHMIQHFPWRLALIGLAMCFGFYAVMFAPYNMGGVGMALALNAAVFLPLINLFTGFITNPIRLMLRKLIDKSFLKWQKKNTNK